MICLSLKSQLAMYVYDNTKALLCYAIYVSTYSYYIYI